MSSSDLAWSRTKTNPSRLFWQTDKQLADQKKKTDHWQNAADAAVERVLTQAVQTAVPDGFMKLQDVPEKDLLPTKRPPAAMAENWYYNGARQLFWSPEMMKLYVLDPVSRMPVEFREPVVADFKVSVGFCFPTNTEHSRHVVMKDLAKAGMSFDHLDKPSSIYALYEGHRGTQSNICVEFCWSHLHQRLLQKLADFRGYWEDRRLQAVMVDTFEELDAEFASKHPDVVDGCCALVVLQVGARMVIASLGDVACMVYKRDGETFEWFMGEDHESEDDDDEDDDEKEEGSDASFPWSHAFGDLDLKKSSQVSATPVVNVASLDAQYSGLALVCRGLYKALGPAGGRKVAVSTILKRSRGRPRIAAGAFVDAAGMFLGQDMTQSNLGAIVTYFDHEQTKARADKRRKVTHPSQVRVRHILLKHRGLKFTMDKVRNKQVERTINEAEKILRGIQEECEIDVKSCAVTFTQRCREHSECSTCLAEGDLAGDLGWVKPGKNEQKFGPAFDDAVFPLQVGQLSDLVDSDLGIHIFLRTG